MKAAIILIVIGFLITLSTYSQLPENIVTHWNIRGEPDGVMPKAGAFIVPALSLGLLLLFFVLPRFDPRNDVGRSPQYSLVIASIMGFMTFMQGLVLAWNLGFVFSLTKAMIPALSILFFLMGHSLRNIKQNWTMGIRTPWTLESKVVWEKTNRFGGTLFMISSGLLLLTLFREEFFFIIMMGIAVIVSVAASLYSYLEFRKEKRIKPHQRK